MEVKGRRPFTVYFIGVQYFNCAIGATLRGYGMAVYFQKAVVSVLGRRAGRLYVDLLRCAATRQARHKALEGILSILLLVAKEKTVARPFLDED
jgi:hypothetical protein